jgi:hypothetical protein
MAVKVERGAEHFRLLAPGAEGPLVCYGEVATLKIGLGTSATLYTCDIEDPDCPDEDILVEKVTQTEEVVNREIEDVLFEGEEEEEIEGGEDDEEEEEEEEVDAGPTLVS